MNRRSWLLLWRVAPIAAVAALGLLERMAEAETPVSVSDTGPRYRTSQYAGHVGHKYQDRTVTFHCGDVRYGIHYLGCVDESHKERVGVVEGSVGMPAPSRENWYGGGFLRLKLNGVDVGSYRLAAMQVTEQGERGGVDMVWDTAEAVVRMRFMRESGANHVKAEVSWTPKAEIKEAAIELTCYPSFFTSWHKRVGDRHVATPRVDEKQGKSFDVVPDKDTYLFYYDTIFDVARGEGVGPCAMMFLPEAVAGGRVNIGDYGISTLLRLKPDARRVLMAFWEFYKRPNAEAAAYLKEHAAVVQKELATVDFRPVPVAFFDPAKCKAEVAKLLQAAGEDGKPYRKQAEQLTARLEALKAKADDGDWQAETELANRLPELDRLVWDLRIQALLSDGDAK